MTGKLLIAIIVGTVTAMMFSGCGCFQQKMKGRPNHSCST
jgi:hypothetical protein